MRSLGDGRITASTGALGGNVTGLATLVAGSALLLGALSGDVTLLSAVLGMSSVSYIDRRHSRSTFGQRHRRIHHRIRQLVHHRRGSLGRCGQHHRSSDMSARSRTQTIASSRSRTFRRIHQPGIRNLHHRRSSGPHRSRGIVGPIGSVYTL